MGARLARHLDFGDLCGLRGASVVAFLGPVSGRLVLEAPARRLDAGRAGVLALTARRPLAGFVRPT